MGSPFLVPLLVRRAIRATSVRTVDFLHSELVRTYDEPYVRHLAAAPARVVLHSAERAFSWRVTFDALSHIYAELVAAPRS